MNNELTFGQVEEFFKQKDIIWNVPNIKFTKTRDVKSPARAHITDAGIDWFIPEDFPKTRLEIGQSVLIPSGIKVIIPKGFMLMAANKSGVATKKGLVLGACIVDEMYRNEVHIHLIKVSNADSIENEYISPGDKIAQFILIPVNYAVPSEISCDEYSTIIQNDEEGSRGLGGFGSSGNI